MTESKPAPEDMLARAYSVSLDEEIRALYRDWAEHYDETLIDQLGYLSPPKSAALLSRKLGSSNTPILDVGSGTGLAGEALANIGFTNLDALDYSPEMLAIARRRKVAGRPVYNEIIEADLNKKLDIRDSTYGGLICTGTFTHGHVGAACLDELFRILRPGGCFACTIHEDIWQEAGFDEKILQLTKDGIMQTISMEQDRFFDSDREDQGWFIVWEKLA